MRQFIRGGRVVRLAPGFKALHVLEGARGRPLVEGLALTFLSNGEREEAIDARVAELLKAGWVEVAVRAAAQRKAAAAAAPRKVPARQKAAGKGSLAPRKTPGKSAPAHRKALRKAPATRVSRRPSGKSPRRARRLDGRRR